MHNIYLDNNATTNILPEVWAYMSEFVSKPMNSSSVHNLGREARKYIENAKDIICKSLNINKNDYRIIFTSSGTETNNWVVNYIENVKVITSKTEHASILNSREDLMLIDVDNNGHIDLNQLEVEIQKHNKPLVSVMYANNETGVIQDIVKIREITKKYGAMLHSDMIQAVGKVKVDLASLDLDAFTLSSHKIHGAQGVGALFIKRGIPLAPMHKGGGQNQGLRAGTENTIGIIGMAKAIEIAVSNIDSYTSICVDNQKFLETEILKRKGAKIISQGSKRLPNTSLIYMPDVPNETQLISFDMAGIAISSGAACSSGKIAASHVLLAQGMNESEARCVVRVSTSQFTTKNEIEEFIKVWDEIYQKNVKTEEICR
ncbi:MAG: cysteine desulfurase [Alphaproteobacteria bacterium]|nr:cysteine desulfurase [Alphaproteobacteria bacterium]OJV15818.1 MAG: hypothetical protein BGO27_07890 [Alphaproteobacteria bacterium 33-17]